MKAYVFITLNLCAMHGANMYIYNKTQFLKGLGYKVLVYSGEQGDIVIPGLKAYKKYQSSCLRFYPACFTKKKVNDFIDRVCEEIDIRACEEITVESTNIYSALWGELFAEKLQCKHLTIILQERFAYSQAEKDFLRFKLKRHELSGIDQASVGKMLGDASIPLDSSMYVTAYCNNTIDECEDYISPGLASDAQITIGSIGRLEKSYVLPLARQLSVYCQARSDTTFNVVFIGGTREEKQYQRIRDVFKNCANVHLVLTGSVFPIPRSFVDRCDLFISAAGSARATYYCGRPTIDLNPVSADIIGIIGLTFDESDYEMYASNYPISDLENIIALLLKDRDKIRYVGNLNDPTYKEEMTGEFRRQLGFLALCDDRHYYNTMGIKFTQKAYRPFNVLGKFVSPRLLYNGLTMARKLIK